MVDRDNFHRERIGSRSGPLLAQCSKPRAALYRAIVRIAASNYVLLHCELEWVTSESVQMLVVRARYGDVSGRNFWFYLKNHPILPSIQHELGDFFLFFFFLALFPASNSGRGKVQIDLGFGTF